MSGYEAFNSAAALTDLSARGKIRMTGEDRVRLLHAMSTNHIEELRPGQSCYALLLNAQGRILADFQVYCFEDHLLLDTEPEVREKVYQQLDNYIIADDVTLEDSSEALCELAIEGPQAAEVLASAGLPVPEGEGDFGEADGVLAARVSATGAPGYRLLAPVERREALIDLLTRAGAVEASPDEARMARIGNGRPRYGEELTEDYIPHEAQVMRALHFNKGCYLGQEIVERVRSRGNVNKLLVQLRLAGDAAPEPGVEVIAGKKAAGTVVSAAKLPDGIVAMAYLRAASARPGAALSIGGQPAEITLMKPV